MSDDDRERWLRAWEALPGDYDVSAYDPVPELAHFVRELAEERDAARAEIDRLRAALDTAETAYPRRVRIEPCPLCRDGDPDLSRDHSCAYRDAERALAAARDPDCIECGGEGAPCCDPPDMPTPEQGKRGMSIGTWPFNDPPAFLGDTPSGLGDMRIVPTKQTESEGGER